MTDHVEDVATILPPNASAAERALDRAFARIGAVPVPIKDFWRVEDCPTELLPWLAAERSVDLWRSEWPEDIRRDLILAARLTHSRKGTPSAFHDALNTLGARVEIVEWWQEEPEATPQTATVTAIFRPGGIMAGSTEHLPTELARIAREIIASAKRFSIHVAVKVGLATGQDFALAQGGAVGLRLAGDAEPKHPLRNADFLRGLAQGGGSAVRLAGDAHAAHPARQASALRALATGASAAIRLSGTAFAVAAP